MKSVEDEQINLQFPSGDSCANTKYFLRNAVLTSYTRTTQKSILFLIDYSFNPHKFEGWMKIKQLFGGANPKRKKTRHVDEFGAGAKRAE